MLMLLLAAVAAFATNYLEIGDSNTNGTVTDTIYSGDPVPVGYLYRHNGTDYTTWPLTNKPSVGKLPYLVDLSMVNGSATGWVIRRGTNGATTSWPGTIQSQWDGAKADVLALGGTPDKVIITFGANDSKTEAKANAYYGNMVLLIDKILVEWPQTEIILVKEKTTNAGATNIYHYLRTTIYDSITDLDNMYPEVQVVDGTLCDLFDAIHFSTGGHGNGQQCVANLIYPL